MKKLIFVFAAIFTLSNNARASIEPVVVANPQLDVSLSPSIIKNIFLGRWDELPDGTPIDIVEQYAESEIRIQFHNKFTGKNQSQLNAFRAKLVFTGRGKIPREVNNVKELEKLLLENPNFIGYMDRANVPDSLKIVGE
jgi:hypothetical protein